MKLKVVISTILAVVSQLLTPYMVYLAYQERGYFAIGGEYGGLILSILCTFYANVEFMKKYNELKELNRATTRKYVCKLYEVANLTAEKEVKKKFDRMNKAS